MWLITDFEQVGLFSLKNSMATSSGGKSLLVPTPYALKMALVDAACRSWGVSRAESIWPTVRDLRVAVRLPQRAVVTNLFAKILKPRRAAAAPGAQHKGPLGKTIAYREYVWADGCLAVALHQAQGDRLSELAELVLQINYLGKRGGFVQPLASPSQQENLPEDFVVLNPVDGQNIFDCRGIVQMLDDCGPSMTFDHANIYSNSKVRLGHERVLNHVVLPYSLTRSSKSYSLYERIDD